MGIHFAHAAGRRERVRNPVFLTKTLRNVSSVTFFLQNNGLSLLYNTPSYKLKKEKQDAKRVDNPTPTEDIALVDPASISVIGAVGGAASSQSPSVPPEKKTKKDKPPSVKPKKSASSSTDDRFSELDAKWSERFNRLEALLMAKTLEPSYSADVRVTPVHSPPATGSKDSEPFFQPPHRPVDSVSKCIGPDSDAALQLSAGKLPSGSSSQDQTVSTRTGPDVTATKQQSAGKPKSDHHSKTSSGRTGQDVASSKHKSTGKPYTDPHRQAVSSVQKSGKSTFDRPPTDRPSSAGLTGSESPTLPKSSGKDSISSIESDAESNLSDTPPLELFVEEGEPSDETRVGRTRLTNVGRTNM